MIHILFEFINYFEFKTLIKLLLNYKILILFLVFYRNL